MRKTNKIVASALAGVMAVSMIGGIVASAGFNSTLLKDAGSSTYAGTTYNFKNSATISTSVNANSNEMTATGTVTLYERDGLDVPTNIQLFVTADLYNEEGTLIRSKMNSNVSSCKRLSVSASYTGSKSVKYYCKGSTRVDLSTVNTYQTSTIGA